MLLKLIWECVNLCPEFSWKTNSSICIHSFVKWCFNSTIGNKLAKALNCSFLDADDFHPESNKGKYTNSILILINFFPMWNCHLCHKTDKMKRGIALSDKDRIPWLQTLRDALRKHLLSKKDVVLGCSALQKNYREILRSADPNYKQGSYNSMVKFVLLDAPAEVIAARLQKRAAEGNHFMPTSLLQSQLDSLQLDPSEGILKVDATQSPDSIVFGINDLLVWSSISLTETSYSTP